MSNYRNASEPLTVTDRLLYNGPDGVQGVAGEPCRVSREISIKPLNYGYLIRVGCQEVAVEDYKTLIKNLESYLKDPSKFEEKWGKKKELL